MFASPAGQLDSEIATTIIRTHLEGILTSTNRKLSHKQQWFSEISKPWVLQNHDLSYLWHPAFSQLECDLKNLGEITNEHLVAAALAMHESSPLNPWVLETIQNYHYRFQQYCLPCGSKISWHTNDTRSHQLYCDDTPYTPTSILDTVTLKHKVIFDTRLNKNTEKLPYAVSNSGWNTQLWQEAFSLLTESAPHYAHWSSQLLRTIVPIDAPKGHQISASHWHRRGEILMSWRIKPHQVAEMMVHEASHQHFFMAGMLSPYDDGSDKTLYYSPVVNAKRPITKILLAYHAFANVILFFRHCHNYLETKEQHWLDKETNKVLAELDQLEQPLRQSKSLTELGQRLWRPLAQQMHEAS